MIPDKWQEQALDAWDDPNKPRIAMQACAGPGKSAIEAICGWHFLICQGDRAEHPNAFALSMDGENLKSGLWKEFAVWYGRALPFVQKPFEWQKEQIDPVRAGTDRSLRPREPVGHGVHPWEIPADLAQCVARA